MAQEKDRNDIKELHWWVTLSDQAILGIQREDFLTHGRECLVCRECQNPRTYSSTQISSVWCRIWTLRDDTATPLRLLGSTYSWAQEKSHRYQSTCKSWRCLSKEGIAWSWAKTLSQRISYAPTRVRNAKKEDIRLWGRP